MKKIESYIDIIIFLCISFFPILDLITAIMTYNGLSVSLGIVIKALLLVFVYLFALISKSIGKFTKGVIILFTVYMIGNVANNYTFVYPNLNIEYVKLIIKFAYFIVFALFFSSYLKNKKYDISILKTPIKIILISLILAIITGTSMPSYASNVYKIGVEGWFYSANELGGLLTLLYPISIYLFFHHESSKKIDWLYVGLHALSLLLLGTKVGLLGFIAVSAIYVGYRLIFIKKYSYKNGLLLMIALLSISLVCWNQLPCIKNTNEKYIAVSGDYIPSNPTKEEANANKQEIVDEMIFSGRHEFLEMLKQTKDDTDKDLVNKDINEKSYSYKKIANDYLGYMYMNNGNLLLTERDFHDVVFFFGYLGLAFLLFVIIYPIVSNIKFLIKRVFDLKIDMLMISIIIICGIAYISGHTFISPMVSFYIAILLGLIACESETKISSKKKLLISTVHMDFGGIEQTLINLLRNLDYDKYEVNLLLQLNEGPLIKKVPSSVVVITPYGKILGKIINNKNIVCKIIKHILYNKYTAFLWTQNKTYDVAIDYAGYYDFITYYVAASNAHKKIIWVHSQPKFIIKEDMLSKYKMFDKIVLVSKSALKEMKRLYPGLKKKLAFMWNIIDVPNKAEENIKWDSQLKILAVGRLTEAKRFDKLIETAALLKKDKIDFSIKVIGDGALEKELKSLAEKLDVTDVIDFVGSKSNVGDYMQKADIYAIVSDYEGLPTVVLEALSCGLVVVAMDIPAMREISDEIAPKDSCILTKNNVKEYAKAIKKLKLKNIKEFDLDNYNKTNIKSFEKLLSK